MHPLAPIRRQLKARDIAAIHSGLAAVTPEQAAALLADLSVDPADGALLLGRAWRSGAAAQPYRTYAALRLLDQHDHVLRAEIRAVRLCFTAAEDGPLDLTCLAALPALRRLSLRRASGLRALPLLPALEALELRGESGLDLATVLSQPLRELALVGQALSADAQEALAAQGQHLESLSLRDCTGLSALPPLPRLCRLTVSGCGALAVPLEGMPALTHLWADVPVRPPAAAGLREVTLEGAGVLEGPLSLPALERLRAPSVEVESALSRCPALSAVTLERWSGAGLDPLQPASGLRELVLWSAPALESLGALAGLELLEVLWLGAAEVRSAAQAVARQALREDAGLESLDGLAPLGGLPTLRELRVRGARMVGLGGLEGAAALEVLELTDCGLLEQVDALEGAQALRRVALAGCQNIQHVHGLRALPALERVVLPAVKGQRVRTYAGEELAALKGRLAEGHARLAAMASDDPMVLRVRELLMHGDLYHQRQALEVMRSFGDDFAEEVVGDCHLSEAGELVAPFGEPSESLLLALAELGRTPQPLKRLVLRGSRFGRLDVLRHLPELESLELRECDQLTSLDGIEHCKRLQRLEIVLCHRLADIGALRWVRSLESLRITGRVSRGGLMLPPRIGTAALRVLDNLPYLRELDLSGCGALELTVLGRTPHLRRLQATGFSPPDSLSRLGHLGELEVLALDECDKLEDLYALRGMPRLKALALTGGVQARDLHALAGLQALETLHIGGPNLTDATPLGGLMRLRELTLEQCDALHSVSFLQNLPDLRKLYLEGPQVVDLRALRGLSVLESLTLQNLPRLRTLDGLEGCAALRALSVETGCGELRYADALLDVPALERLRLLEGGTFQLPPRRDEREGHQGQVRLHRWLRRLRSFLVRKRHITLGAMRDALSAGDAAAVEAELSDLRSFADPRLTGALLLSEDVFGEDALSQRAHAAVIEIDVGLRR